jgi:hypothetical protein
MKKHNI